MRGWARAGLALAIAAAAVPAAGQNSFSSRTSPGEAFLKAVTDGDNAAAVPMIKEPGSRVVNYKGYDGETALHIVTRKRKLDWVGFLLNNGANPSIPDSKGDTALHVAARMGFDQAAVYMIEEGARIDADNRAGETPLTLAVQANQPRMVELLLAAGANPDKGDHVAGLSPRDYAKRNSRNPQLLKLIETVKATKKKVAGPSLN
ncbi:MAG TPA: ankyrin repeat domain-containing protein [Sphingomicrobium sp.]|nr:ankyrin repeat domain-containing protein [Sphingomicrobium sp.]